MNWLPNQTKLRVISLPLVFVITLLFLNFVTASVFHPTNVHSTAFEEIKAGKRVNESTLDQHKAASIAKCGTACNKNAKCRSFNFCDDGICELNRHDIYSTVNGEKILQEDVKCKYYGMFKEAGPKCSSGEERISIENTDDIKRCEIHEKRVDRIWGEQQVFQGFLEIFVTK